MCCPVQSVTSMDRILTKLYLDLSFQDSKIAFVVSAPKLKLQIERENLECKFLYSSSAAEWQFTLLLNTALSP